MCEEDKCPRLRDQVLTTRKCLLDVSSSLILNSKHPFKALNHFESLIGACSSALSIVELRSERQILSAARPALQSLEAMEKSASYKGLFLNVQQFGSRLHAFLEMAAVRCIDIKNGKDKCDIIAR